MEAAVRQVFDRRVVLDADLSGDPARSEAAEGLVGPLPGGGEPEGLREADEGLVRVLDAGDHGGAPLRWERAPVWGFGGRSPRPSAAPAAAREPGVRRGAQPPLA
ncbi:MAG: hypothetical protein OXU35_10580, partial [Acidobacteriota bacterium]|nr:hypothetical protein [Acidobacteriota bacterium]